MLLANALHESPLVWVVFSVIIVTMMAFDLGVLHRKAHIVSMREAWTMMAVWITLGLGFGAWVWYQFTQQFDAQVGRQRGLEYITAYLIELALSVDNIFVFIVLFRYFSVPAELKHRVLFWGIVGAILMRGVLIFAGTALIERFHWMIYVFGAILLITGIKLMFSGDENVHPERNPLLRLARRLMPITPNYEGQHFIFRREGRLWATPLLLVLLVVESTDLLFALDSVPAVIGINPRDPSKLIIITSNVFAILGLRSMYFVLAGILDKFRFLKYGLAIVLAFVGMKMLLSHWGHLPIAVSLSVVAGIIGLSVLASMLIPPKSAEPSDGR